MRSTQAATGGSGLKNGPRPARRFAPAWPLLSLGLLASLLTAASASAGSLSNRQAQSSQPNHAAEPGRGAPPPGAGQAPMRGGLGGPGQRGNNPRQEHLSEWMSRHQNLTPEQQQKALQQEPGFSKLPPQAQQRILARLGQLNAMNPEQRQRVMNRVEAMERLTPEQRGQVTAATQSWHALPEDRRRLVGKAFRDLREMPPEQRQAVLDSPRFHDQFDDHERGVLQDLLNVEPYLPPPVAGPPQYGGKQ